MSTAIVWFRRDLRLTDNAALLAACEAADAVIPVYVYSPDDEGEWAPGGAQRWWLHHSLAKLAEELEARGSRLVLREGRAAEMLAQLVEETDADQVHWNRLYDPAIVERDKAIKAELRERGLVANSHAGALLAEPWLLETGAGKPYRVFTPYWRNFLKNIRPEAPRAAPEDLPTPDDWPGSADLEELGLLPTLDWIDGLADAWTPGESAAQCAMDAFMTSRLDDYADARDIPSRPGTSRLSPHLHFGELSPRQAWYAAAARQSESGLTDQVEHFQRELGWREFAHHVLFHFPETPGEPMDERFSAFPWREDSDELLEAWQRGRTGFPIVDAGMRQLYATGWMHNRVRMIVASLLVKNLRIPWQSGAAWFWDTLVDADLASNTMGWQWAAGCGADAAPYFRIFNPIRQSERFDAAGEYVRRWVPELESLEGKALHAPWESGDHERLGYPAPVVDLKKTREEALTAFEAIK